MNPILALIVRRMRTPLMVLIGAYAVSMVGLVLIPGPAVNGTPWHMSFFHAFYFVSYMGSTIGFGEIPHAFSDAQRLWVVFSIYLTVTAWLYAIGKILGLVQDPALRQMLEQHAFARAVRRIPHPFYIVCGHGETGSLLVRELTRRDTQAVVVDVRAERITEVLFANYPLYVPSLVANAGRTSVLVDAGLLHPLCSGVVAVTDDDGINLKIALTAKLLNPRLRVSSRADHAETATNLTSFGTEQVIEPFPEFAAQLALALHSPLQHTLRLWLTGLSGTTLPEPLSPPHGTWLLCGYGRFGKAIHEELAGEGIQTVIIEPDPEAAAGAQNVVAGRGVDVETLLKAGVKAAAGIVAGTDNDTNNLSIILTARALNPELFLVARQNRRDHETIFDAAGLDLRMQRSETVARRILAQLVSPLLKEFLDQLRYQDRAWIQQLVERLYGINEGCVPEVWSLLLWQEQAPGVVSLLDEGRSVQLGDLFRDPRDRALSLPGFVLLLRHQEGVELLPDEARRLRAGDRVLFCTPPGSRRRMSWGLQNRDVLLYLVTGEERPRGVFWRWLEGRVTTTAD